MRSKHETKLNNELQAQLMLFLGQNESKKSKSLTETIDNLSTQIDQYQAVNSEQSEVMESLKSQMEAYRLASDEEKRELRQQIEDLRNDLDCEKNRKKKCTIL